MAGTLVTSTLSTGTKAVALENLITSNIRAWVNFDGSTAPINIKQAYNVSSITDLGVGLYTINFSTVFSNTNYMFFGTGRTRKENDFSLLLDQRYTDIKTISACSIRTQVNGSGQVLFDSEDVGVAFIGG